MSDAKICDEVQAALDGEHVVVSLEQARTAGWKNIRNNTAADMRKWVIFDIIKRTGTPIRAVVTNEEDSTTGKVICVTTCQECGVGVRRAAQDVWQSAFCDSHSKTSKKAPSVNSTARAATPKATRTPKVKGGGKYVSSKAAIVKQMIDSGYTKDDSHLKLSVLEDLLKRKQAEDGALNEDKDAMESLKREISLLKKAQATIGKL